MLTKAFAACPAAWHLAVIMQHEVKQLMLMMPPDCRLGCELQCNCGRSEHSCWV